MTQISLANAKALIKGFGLPDAVEIYRDFDQESGAIEHLVEARWKSGMKHVFSGFSWGYSGEGPHGLQTFLNMLHFTWPITLRQIVMWPQEGFPALTYIRGEDYDLPQEVTPC